MKPSPQRRSGKRGHRAHPRYRALDKVYIIPLDVPAGGAPGVTPSPAPCGSSDTGPGSSGSVSSAYCVASWSSSVGYPQVLFLLSGLPVCCLWCCWVVLSVHINALPPLRPPLRGTAEDGVHNRAPQRRRWPKTTIRRWPQWKITRRLGRIRLCGAIPHRLRRIRPGLPESPALAYVPERSWLRWHPHEATVAQTARGYSFTPSPSGNPRGRSATTATRSASYPLSVLSNRTTTYRISGYPLSTRISVKRAPVVV